MTRDRFLDCTEILLFETAQLHHHLSWYSIVDY